MSAVKPQAGEITTDAPENPSIEHTVARRSENSRRFGSREITGPSYAWRSESSSAIDGWQYLTLLFNINSYTGQTSVLSTRKTKRSSTDAQLDRVFHALGDRTRRALLTRLARGPAMVTELAGPFQMSLPAVSRHIRVLEKARLVRRSVDGRVHRCSLRAEPLEEAQHWLNRYRPFWEGTLHSRLLRRARQR